MRNLAIVFLAAVTAVSMSACAELKGRRNDTPIGATGPVPAVAAAAPTAEPLQSKPIRLAPQRGCVPRTLPPPPRYPDNDIALRDAPGAADRYQLMAAGRLMRQKRLEELERIVAGCR